MRDAGLFGAWVRSLLVGPLGLMALYVAACLVLLWFGARRDRTRFLTVLPWLLGFAATFLVLCLPYPAYVLELPLVSWSARLEDRYPVDYPRDAATQRRTAIVVFGAGVLPGGIATPGTLQRLETAISIWRQIPESTLILTEGGIGLWEQSEGWFRLYLHRCGVSDKQILVETKGMTTWQNARNCVQLLRASETQNVVLVTDRTHLPRSWLCLRRHGIMPQVRGAGVERVDLELTFSPSWYSLSTFYGMINEYVGIVGYRLMGWL